MMKFKKTLSALIATIGLTFASAGHAVIYSEVVYRSFCKFRFARGLLGGERRRVAPEVTAQQAARRWV